MRQSMIPSPFPFPLSHFSRLRTSPSLGSQMIGSLWKGSHYVRSPAGRGEKVAELTQHSHILFTKAFWNIFELSAIRVRCDVVEAHTYYGVKLSGDIVEQSCSKGVT